MSARIIKFPTVLITEGEGAWWCWPRAVTATAGCTAVSTTPAGTPPGSQELGVGVFETTTTTSGG